MGRSSECFVVLNDSRASRHHADVRWDGRQWTVVDRGSTNGTYVNGLQVHEPYDVHPGDRVTIGESTLVLREFSAQPPAPTAARRPASGQARRVSESDRTAGMGAVRGPAQPSQSQATSRPAAARPATRRRSKTGATTVFWLVQAVIASGVSCLAVGAFLPWLRLTSVTDLSSPPVTISGLDGYGRLTLLVVVLAGAAWAVDCFSRRSGRQTVWVGLGYVVLAALAIVVIGSNLIVSQRWEIKRLLGVRLAALPGFAAPLTGWQLTFLAGSILTLAGLALLLAGELCRLAWVILIQNRREGNQWAGNW